jgi:hypothetical protein
MENKLFLPREIFNSLVTSLDYFISLENEIGETFFSKYSAKLKNKILKHARIFKNAKNENSDNVSIYFFGNESMILLKLLIYYISLGENHAHDYFSHLEKRGSRKSKNIK